MNSTDYPITRQAAAAASRNGQSHYFAFLKGELALVLVAAAIGVGAPFASGEAGVAVAFILAALLICAIMVRLVNRQRRPERAWYDGRALAESLKTATWKFMMKADPFTGPTSDHEFVALIKDLRKDAKDLPTHVAGTAAMPAEITTYMNTTRGLSVADRAKIYRDDRLNEQRIWYSDNSKKKQGTADRWFYAWIAAQIVAILFAVGRIAVPGIPNFVGLLTSFVAAIAAWTQAQQYDELSKRYSVAAYDLVAINADYPSVTDEATLSKLVSEGEEAISREHASWRARRS